MYSVKWVTDNLGITRDMLRYYEKEHLIPENCMRNPVNKYREFNEEDIDYLWAIKLLLGIGFTAKEVHSFINDQEFDFDAAIAKKVNELERKLDENQINLQFAKSIKLTGSIPTVVQIGSVRFEKFLQHARKNWNFYDDPHSAPFMKMLDKVVSNNMNEWNSEDVEHLLSMMKDAESMMHAFALHGYYQLIADMKELGYSNETVQRAVSLLYRYVTDHPSFPESDNKITPAIFAKYMACSFIIGDLAVLNERNYGKDGCLFIAKAIAYYGGLNLEDL